MSDYCREEVKLGLDRVLTLRSWLNSSTEEEVLTTRLIEKAIRKSEAVDRESLCILAGEKVGTLVACIVTPTLRCDLPSNNDLTHFIVSVGLGNQNNPTLPLR